MDKRSTLGKMDRAACQQGGRAPACRTPRSCVFRPVQMQRDFLSFSLLVPPSVCVTHQTTGTNLTLIASAGCACHITPAHMHTHLHMTLDVIQDLLY